MSKVTVFFCLFFIVTGLSATSTDNRPSVIQISLANSAYDLRYYADDDEFGPINEQNKKKPEKEKQPKKTQDKEKPLEMKPDSSQQRKSLIKAVAYSALLPGAGEWYVGNRAKAKYFFGAEAAIWIGFTSFTIFKNWKHDDMIQYGNQHANAQLDGRTNEFLDLVGFYSSIDDYNTNGRSTDPDRPYLADTPENHWRWDTDGSQKAFRSLKNSYREAKRRSQFILGVAVIDRVLSIIDVVRDVHRHNNRIGGSDFSDQPAYKLYLSFHPASDTQVRLTLLTPF